jgi:Bax protein
MSVTSLAVIVLSVLALYALVLLGGMSPLSRYLGARHPGGTPVGLETSLSGDDLASAHRLDQAFARMDYRLDAIAGGREVPPVFLASVPGDLANLPVVDTKKRVFLRVMLPLVLVVNEEIAADRRRLDAIAQRRARNQYINDDDQAWLTELAERYGLAAPSLPELQRRVDVVAPSLALAQAAEESGWGTSRFTLEANNLFGHYTTGTDGVAADGDPSRRLAAFGTLHEAVRAYIHNLNTHRAYEPLRRTRAAARARGAHPDGHSLAGALTAYSERGPAYVDSIRALIRKNNLLRFDHARLGNARGRAALARHRVVAMAE